jgi:hypothetical protein
LKRPSVSVRVSANCLGGPALAAHKVTVDPAIGAPAPATRPLIGSANAGRLDNTAKVANALIQGRTDADKIVL